MSDTMRVENCHSHATLILQARLTKMNYLQHISYVLAEWRFGRCWCGQTGLCSTRWLIFIEAKFTQCLWVQPTASDGRRGFSRAHLDGAGLRVVAVRAISGDLEPLGVLLGRRHRHLCFGFMHTIEVILVEGAGGALVRRGDEPCVRPHKSEILRPCVQSLNDMRMLVLCIDKPFDKHDLVRLYLNAMLLIVVKHKSNLIVCV